jgi:hypothetical protein
MRVYFFIDKTNFFHSFISSFYDKQTLAVPVEISKSRPVRRGQTKEHDEMSLTINLSLRLRGRAKGL